MLLAITTALIAFALATTAGFRARGRADAAQLGWMSEQWLADYRAHRM